MAEIEKMSTDEMRVRIEAIGPIIDESIDRLSADDFTDSKLTDRELKALLMGELSALIFVYNFYLGGMDERSPEEVAVVRRKSAKDIAATLIRSAATTFNRFFTEGGDE